MRIQLSPRELADLIREIATVREDSWVRKPGNRQHSVVGGHYTLSLEDAVKKVITKREIDPRFVEFFSIVLCSATWNDIIWWADDVIEKDVPVNPRVSVVWTAVVGGGRGPTAWTTEYKVKASSIMEAIEQVRCAGKEDHAGEWEIVSIEQD